MKWKYQGPGEAEWEFVFIDDWSKLEKKKNKRLLIFKQDGYLSINNSLMSNMLLFPMESFHYKTATFSAVISSDKTIRLVAVNQHFETNLWKQQHVQGEEKRWRQRAAVYRSLQSEAPPRLLGNVL